MTDDEAAALDRVAEGDVTLGALCEHLAADRPVTAAAELAFACLARWLGDQLLTAP